MHQMAVLRKVSGSVMLPIPSVMLEVLSLNAGNAVAVSVEGGRLVVEPARRPRYTLEDLLARCDADAPWQDDERAWLDGAAAGRELIC